MKIGFFGAGNMGSPILAMCAQKGIFASEDIYVYDADFSKAQALASRTGTKALATEDEITDICGVIMLCVKPQVFPELLPRIAKAVREHGIFTISIAAGKTTAYTEGFLGEGAPVGRIFPNLNANVGQACSAYCAGRYATAQQKELTGRIAASFGDAYDYPEELFPVFGVLGGCAPAYSFMFISALADAAKANGMDEKTALSAAIQTVLGSAMYMKESCIAPSELIDRVCSKGGTTIEGVNSLRESGLDEVVKKAFGASLARDKFLAG